eukprot:CAMPEP_0118634992 /NCGR_PEP_ID=MMETSP0785-20121206/1841_1 /TAXON_ID=91992 /ORGANISM="Bolidomonas pacifica, Strain CCMP 1866" /LENGTH=494 /DNA_ID=CAMNT_0006526001 /DNA_START=189 /DNA_END=1673 /DNA_ORIENTATION=-
MTAALPASTATSLQSPEASSVASSIESSVATRRAVRTNLRGITFLNSFLCQDCDPSIEAPALPSVSSRHGPLLALTNTSLQPLQHYLDVCRFYGTRPNPGVLSTFRFTLAYLRPTPPFHDRDMISLAETINSYKNTSLSFIKRLDLSHCSRFGRLPTLNVKGIRSSGGVAVGKCLEGWKNLEELRIDWNKVGKVGSTEIARGLRSASNVSRVSMRGCYMGAVGAEAFGELVVGCNDNNKLEDIDLSVNAIGHIGITRLAKCLAERKERGGGSMVIDVEANMILQEVMNAVTHGVGIILCIIGAFTLMGKSRGYSALAQRCCFMYSCSLLCLYIASTLYHSFFALKNTKFVFSILDHSAIYILIAGSYTPFLGITFSDRPIFGVYMLGFLWLCCFGGVMTEAFAINWKHKGKFSLTMYLAMGWSAMSCLPQLSSRLPSNAITLLVLGGLGYTCGVPFFVRNNNLDHSIWHCFVMAGSIFHWFSIYLYVLELDGKF